MSNQSFLNTTQLVISYELLCLLEWLMDNEPEALKKLVINARENGLQEVLDALENPPSAELQGTILEFLSLLEDLVQEPLSIEDEGKPIALLPAVDHIDSSAFDENMLALSIAQAQSQLKTSPKENAKEILCKKILKNWTPHNKRSVN